MQLFLISYLNIILVTIDANNTTGWCIQYTGVLCMHSSALQQNVCGGTPHGMRGSTRKGRMKKENDPEVLHLLLCPSNAPPSLPKASHMLLSRMYIKFICSRGFPKHTCVHASGASACGPHAPASSFPNNQAQALLKRGIHGVWGNAHSRKIAVARRLGNLHIRPIVWMDGLFLKSSTFQMGQQLMEDQDLLVMCHAGFFWVLTDGSIIRFGSFVHSSFYCMYVCFVFFFFSSDLWEWL